MPKMKTKSAAKKRFKLTGTGKVKAGAANKRHCLSAKPNDMKRQSRGTFVLFKTDGENVKKFYLPNGAK
ncbi:50S ribosomal protein L35 [Magnetospirillum sp. 64-120]|uniref:50S ribosomal protein L35 n=1 Tax=Magnetospirillum sp. 64-120 TaxID=1895778 RepID=UPI00092C47B3|nr:50S ribosomal protein L35 [Magnetospirillum sp. 64-120]OJX71358.1 MAG: 50S ribosomal protein L35 [Magnetospirillum sp. 64-120]